MSKVVQTRCGRYKLKYSLHIQIILLPKTNFLFPETMMLLPNTKFLFPENLLLVPKTKFFQQISCTVLFLYCIVCTV